MRILPALLAAAAVLASAPSSAKSDDPAHPDFSGYWGPAIRNDPMPADLKAKLPPNTVVLDDTGPAEFPRGVYGGLILTPAAKAHADTWKPEDEMTLSRVCLPQSVVYAEQGPFPWEIDQAPGLLVFRYEYFDQVRLIHTDGRGHLPADAPHTKMGDSIGHWEGNTLVVDTSYFEPEQHYIDMGIPISDQFHMVERINLLDGGKTMQIQYIMTDPDMWEGEWRSTKRFLREDNTDINEAECILQYNEHLPGTELGSETAKERGQTELKGVTNDK